MSLPCFLPSPLLSFSLSGKPLKSPLAVSSDVFLYIAKQYSCAAIPLDLNCRHIYIFKHMGLPKWCCGKESACQCKRCKRQGFHPWVRKIPLEKEMATCSSILAWEIPWTEEPGGQQSMRLQRIKHYWLHNTHINTHTHTYIHFLLPWVGKGDLSGGPEISPSLSSLSGFRNNIPGIE